MVEKGRGCVSARARTYRASPTASSLQCRIFRVKSRLLIFISSSELRSKLNQASWRKLSWVYLTSNAEIPTCGAGLGYVRARVVRVVSRLLL